MVNVVEPTPGLEADPARAGINDKYNFMLDLVIIGGAAAGCSAAVYAARRKLNFRMITADIGGEVALSGVINNWPGLITIEGFELAQKLAEHVRHYGVTIEEGLWVENIRSEKNFHIVYVKGPKGVEEIKTKTVIIATGIHPRHLDIPGEKEFNRKGVTYCTVCDGPLFKNKITVTVGSGNSALESVIMMNGIAKKVYLFSKFVDTPENKGGFPRGENILIDKVKSLPNVEIIYGATSTEITGKDQVGSLKYKDVSGKAQTLNVDGIMVHIGQIPNSELSPTVKKDPGKQIMVDEKCRTSMPGIFAAGDVTNVAFKQIGIASGQGITAALAAIEYINLWKE